MEFTKSNRTRYSVVFCILFKGVESVCAAAEKTKKKRVKKGEKNICTGKREVGLSGEVLHEYSTAGRAPGANLSKKYWAAKEAAEMCCNAGAAKPPVENKSMKSAPSRVGDERGTRSHETVRDSPSSLSPCRALPCQERVRTEPPSALRNRTRYRLSKPDTFPGGENSFI